MLRLAAGTINPQTLVRNLEGELPMRFLLHVKFPVEQFNAAVRDGSAGKKLERILAAIKHESVYFTEYEGLAAPSWSSIWMNRHRFPRRRSRWFLLLFNATCELHAAMTPQDLAKAGLDALGKKWS